MFRLWIGVSIAIVLLTFSKGFPGAAGGEAMSWDFQSGDAVSISTIPDTGFPNGIYPVQKNGCVELPILGMVKIVQTQKDSFTTLVKDAYIGYIKGPHLEVHRLIRISLLGGFLKPGLYWISPEITLWNALYMAGGTIREDGIKKLKWERNGNLIKMNLASEFQSGATLEELGFVSGDQIVVTSRSKMSGWEVFVQQVVPVLSVSAAVVVASVSLIRK